MSENETRGQKTAAEVGALLRARNALLWVVTPEEKRAERAIIDASAQAGYETRLWDCVAGVTNPEGKETPPGAQAADVMAVLTEIRRLDQAARTPAGKGLRAVWILRDLTPWLRDPQVCRAVRSLARQLTSAPRDGAQSIVVLTPSSEVPPELSDAAIVVKWELPDRAEIGAIFDRAVAGMARGKTDAERQTDRARLVKEFAAVREAAIEAAVGLSAEAAAATYAKSLVTQDGKIVPALVAAEKKRVINREKGIEWFDPDPRALAAIGGLEPLKAWLTRRQSALGERARAFGLPHPKGLLLVGVSGCGKSLLAKATSAAWGVPLLRFDLGATRSKWVGDSEANIRAALAVVGAVGNCVLWCDEIEKALSGATRGAADGGVSADALGVLLQWMQERKDGAFLIATSNDVSQLPPELLRKGRFDELFFVDLPTQREREEILRVTLKQFARDPATIDVVEVARACDGFTGAEIAAIVPDGLFTAFADGERALSTADLLEAAKTVVPLSKTAAEKIDALREWAKGRTRPASLREEAPAGGTVDRNLDLDERPVVEDAQPRVVGVAIITESPAPPKKGGSN